MDDPEPAPEKPQGSADRWAEVSARPTALYRLLDADGTLLYTGITCNLTERWKDHAQDKKKPWWPQVVEKRVEWFPDRRQAEKAELWTIVAHDARYNVSHASPWQKVQYKLRWLLERLDEEEAALRTPRRTPRSKATRQRLADVLEQREVVHLHRPSRHWLWDGSRLRPYPRVVSDPSPEELRRWLGERRIHQHLDIASWYGCKPWPTECLWKETRRQWGECPECVGEQAPCPVVRQIAERYKDHPQYCL